MREGLQPCVDLEWAMAIVTKAISKEIVSKVKAVICLTINNCTRAIGTIIVDMATVNRRISMDLVIQVIGSPINVTDSAN